MKRNIIAFCIFCLCTGSLAACNDFDNPAIPDDEAPEVTPAPVPPAIDPSWNLVQMPDEGGQNPRVFVYKDKKYDALFTRTLGWNGGARPRPPKAAAGLACSSFSMATR